MDLPPRQAHREECAQPPHPGLQPWETWISESQERMTLSVPDESLKEFMDLMERRSVEATVIGKFNDSDRAIIKMNGKTIYC